VTRRKEITSPAKLCNNFHVLAPDNLRVRFRKAGNGRVYKQLECIACHRIRARYEWKRNGKARLAKRRADTQEALRQAREARERTAAAIASDDGTAAIVLEAAS
jgi:hypothetical protein